MYRQKLSILLVGMGILIPIAVWLFPDVPSSTSAKEHFWVDKVHSSDQFDILFIGDSRTYRSMVPQVIDSITGTSALNFGFNAGGVNPEMINSGFQKLKPEGQKILVLGITPSSLLAQNELNSHYNQELNRRATDLWMRHHVSPLLKQFDPIQPGYLYNVIRGRRIGYFEEFKEGGVVLSERVPADTAFALGVYERLFLNEQVSGETVNTLKSSLCEISRQGVQIIGWRPKGSAAMTQIEDSLSGYNESQVRQIVESCGGIWLETPIPEATYDGSHVPMWVAQDFSRNFALQLNQALKKRSQQNN